MIRVPKWEVFEIEFLKVSIYKNPLRDVTLDLILKSLSDREVTIEAFWDGESV